nr:putative reverse transcriptase domain-containing protein [Tanacetum cinerariifolium]
FWSTARIETTEEGTKILATIDGNLQTVSESSIRRNLKLNDEAGINEHASPLGDGNQGEACPTDSDFVADQDRANIGKTSTLPSDSAPRVTSLTADEGSMQQTLDELTALCTSLQRQHSEMVSRFEAQELEINSLKAKIKLLEDKDRGVAEQSGDDAPIKGRRLDEGGVAEVPTASGSIPTAGPPATGVPTGSDVVPTAEEEDLSAMDIQMARQLEEEMERDAQRMNEQISRDAEIARIHAEEELQMMINSLDRSNETTLQRKPRSKKQKKDYYMAVIKGHSSWKRKDFKGMSFEQIEAKFNTVWKQIKDFIPMGSKEEAERLKRKGLRLEQESAKKLKTSEEVPEEVKLSEEVSKEKVKEMMQLVPIEEITRLGGSSASYQFFVDMLKHLDREDLNQLWRLVKESLSIRSVASDKEIELWVELKRLIVGNKIHKEFPLPVMEFPLPGEVSTTSEESSHCQKKRDATAEKIALLLKSSSNCQSKSYDSYANNNLFQGSRSYSFKGTSIQVDAKLNLVEEPIEILESEIKKLKRSRIPIVKVRWNSKRGPEYTWEREDQIKLKYPHLFSSSTS